MQKSNSLPNELRGLFGALGMAKRAGKAAVGTDMACDAARAGTARIGIASSSVSQNTRKRLDNCFSYYHVKLIYIDADPEALGASVGRSGTACIAVTDKNLAELVIRKMNERKDG